MELLIPQAVLDERGDTRGPSLCALTPAPKPQALPSPGNRCGTSPQCLEAAQALAAPS